MEEIGKEHDNGKAISRVAIQPVSTLLSYFDLPSLYHTYIRYITARKYEFSKYEMKLSLLKAKQVGSAILSVKRHATRNHLQFGASWTKLKQKRV